MDHERAFELIPGYLDGELSLSEALDFERHLASCELCQEAYAQQQLASALLQQAHLRVETPKDLTQRIEAALSKRKTIGQRLVGMLRLPVAASPFAWGSVGALALSAVVLSWSAGLYLAVPSGENRLSEELVNNHIRSLQANHLSDVISTDRHTVKPWFNGKIDFAPPVVDLKDQGYPLVGGRLDYVNGRRAAALVFHRGPHTINLFIWPGDGPSAASLEQKTGYNLVHWGQGGLTFWAVSDCDPAALQGFQQAFAAATK
jgi:anti-sigma factor RsiW